MELGELGTACSEQSFSSWMNGGRSMRAWALEGNATGAGQWGGHHLGRSGGTREKRTLQKIGGNA